MKRYLRFPLMLISLALTTTATGTECAFSDPYPQLTDVLKQLEKFTDIRRGRYRCRVDFSGTITHFEPTEKGWVYQFNMNIDGHKTLHATVHGVSIRASDIAVGDPIGGNGLILDEAYANLQMWAYNLKRKKK